MEATIIYEEKEDREFLNLIDSKLPIFINYIDYNTTKGRKEAHKIKSHWGAIKNPFILLSEEDKIIKVFYSEKDNAVQQFVKYLNDSSKV